MMKKEFLESFGGERFVSFSADEASVIAGNARHTVTSAITYSSDGSVDALVDGDISFPEETAI